MLREKIKKGKGDQKGEEDVAILYKVINREFTDRGTFGQRLGGEKALWLPGGIVPQAEEAIHAKALRQGCVWQV